MLPAYLVQPYARKPSGSKLVEHGWNRLTSPPVKGSALGEVMLEHIEQGVLSVARTLTLW